MDTPPETLPALCLFCGSNNTQERWHTTDQDGHPDLVVRCCQCGTHFLHPQPSAERLAQAYATPYYGGDFSTKFNPSIERLREYFAHRRARLLTKGLKKRARILDVGCSEGRLLRTMGTFGDFELHGIELPGRAAERAASNPKINLHTGTLTSCKLPEAAFDLITLVHVFEHLPDPSDAIDKLKRLLKPGGRLFISYPNCSSWQATCFKGAWFHLEPPRHLNLVPPTTLIAKLEAEGFEKTFAAHFNWEQNIYGWTQSFLNLLPAKRNLLYELLKRNKSYTQGQTLPLILHISLAAIITFLAIPIDFFAACARRGATVEILFTHKNTESCTSIKG